MPDVFASCGGQPRVFLLAASVFALMAGSAAAETAAVAPLALPPRTETASPAATAAMLLKHLPAGREELTFRGEMASRRFTVVLGRAEAARIATFQVALRNTVSLLPEHSAVTVTVNGRTLATLPADAAEKTAILPVAIPSGLLVPGANSVQVSSSLTHRVDCSVPATYELWAALDPAQTGFMVPRGAGETVTSMADLAAAPLADDGTTRIRVLVADANDESEITQAARAVQTIVRRAKLVRPIVEVASGRGTGPGFDLVIDGHEPPGFMPLAKAGGIGFARDETSGRLLVEVEAVPEQGQGAAPPERSAPDAAAPPRDGFRRTFAQLGRRTEVFTGRHYEASIPVVLPSDFMSTNDRARLRIDGGHSATMVEGDGLALRVNGTLVSFVPFAAGKAERFVGREIELPLRFFQPGRNDVTLEATTSAEADAQCKTATMPREARLTIADTSELEFPSFVHLTTLPQIPAAMAGQNDLPVYLPGNDPAATGAALTMLANMATVAEAPAMPHVHLTLTGDDGPGLLVAAADQVSAAIAVSLGRITRPAADATPASASVGTAASSNEAPAIEAAPSFRSRLSALLGQGEQLLRSRGFFYGSDKADRLALKPNDILVAAVAPDGKAPRAAFDIMPRITQDPSHWLVVTAATTATLDGGLRQLVADGRWDELRGEATLFDPAGDTLDVRQPRAVTYVLSSQIAAADVRPILGGMMSDNIGMSLVVLLLLMGVLGISTHAVVRRMGVK